MDPVIKKIVFGLKVKQLRQHQQLSFAELAKLSGLSVSYLNEIEKGKKYPKEDKINALAETLGVSVAELTSGNLTKNFKPLDQLLKSNFLNELPLELFGIDSSKVVELISNAPARVGAFISAILDISKSYEVQQESFYFASLRAYQALYENYFEELEDAVTAFRQANGLPLQPTSGGLKTLLKEKYQYEIDEKALGANPQLASLRSAYIPGQNRLLLHPALNESQKAFQLGKELAYSYLGLSPRINSSVFMKVHSFNEVLNNQQASYFSDALLLDRDSMLEELEELFNAHQWNSENFLAMMQRVNASPEMLIQRMLSLLPRFFGLKRIFFLRFDTVPGSNTYRLSKELHLSRKNHPHANGINEHYCRRWSALWALPEMKQSETHGEVTVHAQRSSYYGTEEEYLCITLCRSAYPTPNNHISLTLGMLLDEDLKKVVKFAEDPLIPDLQVNKTCERCAIEDCEKRAAAPIIVQSKERLQKTQEALDALLTEFR